MFISPMFSFTKAATSCTTTWCTIENENREKECTTNKDKEKIKCDKIKNDNDKFKACEEKMNSTLKTCLANSSTKKASCEKSCCLAKCKTEYDTKNNECKSQKGTAKESCISARDVAKAQCDNKCSPIIKNWPDPVMGITCDADLLVNGQCKLNVYDMLGIRKSVRDTGDSTSVGLFVQDVVLSATFFIGTLVTIALIVSWIMFIFAASSGKDPADAKKWIMWSLVGLLLVVSSYVIIRLVQYIAKWF